MNNSSGLLDVMHAPSSAGAGKVIEYHGTAVAGLIAGKPRGDQLTGVVPGATVVDVRVLLTSYGALRPGEDAAKVIYPAGYGRDVVAVSATLGGHPDEAAGGDARTFVLQNSATDLAAPTYGAVTLGLNGST